MVLGGGRCAPSVCLSLSEGPCQAACVLLLCDRQGNEGSAGRAA